MSIRERAAAALVRVREAAIAVPANEPPHRQRLRAALTRDIATLLAVLAGHILVGNDPLRFHGGVPGPLITVDDPDDLYGGLRFVPETGNTGVGGGAYLLLDACPGCGGDPHARGNVPMVAIAGLADLGNYQYALRLNLDPRPVPVEFVDDPAHAPDCPLRSPNRRTPQHRTRRHRKRRPGVSGMRAEITTVGELVAALAAFPPQTRVQLAVAPGYPQAATIGVIACSPDDAEGDGRPPAADEARMVWISEGAPLGYLPEIARSALGQSWA